MDASIAPRSGLELILATDLDGTFLPPENMYEGARLYRLIREHRERIALIFVTGRGFESILTLLDDPSIPIPDYIIADVGGTVLRRQGDGFSHILPLQDEITQGWQGREQILATARQIEGLHFQEVPQEYRCSFTYDSDAVRIQAQALAQSLGLDHLVSANRYFDFLPRGVSKGNSLMRLLSTEGLSPDKVLTAGDTLNDLSLMRTGLKGVVVGNAETGLKEAVLQDRQDGAVRPVHLARAAGPLGILEAIRHHAFHRLLGLAPAETIPLQGDAELVMVYHRQPFDETSTDTGIMRSLPKSPNGILPTLLGCFADGREGAWVAWSLQSSRAPEASVFEQNVWVDRDLYPNLMASRVALTADDVDLFYKQFSKEALWPVLFSFPERVTFNESHWQHFCEINRLFAERTAAATQEGATVWIHDYNLWMVPSYLRALRPDLHICFFHHTAFPGADIFNILPWKGQIVASLLKCDYVGFHIPRYVENFVDVVRSNVSCNVVSKTSCAPDWLTYGCALGVEEMTLQLSSPYGLVGVGAHPVGIDNERIAQLVKTEYTQKGMRDLLAEARGRKIVLSVERLDYVKGPIEKMQAFERFLEEYPQWHEKVIMLNIVTPAATGMVIYEETRQQLDRIVGRINGRFASMNWTPVRYFYRSLPFEELMAFYLASDVAWITPLRDGLNLVCKEYVSAKAVDQTPGVLVLSEFAGAAVELKGAILTNPHDENNLVQVLESALSLSAEEAHYKMRQLQERVLSYGVRAWYEDFLGSARGQLPLS